MEIPETGKKWLCPTKEELSGGPITNVMCPVAGCGRILAQSAALRMHMIKTHRLIQVYYLH